MHYTLRISSAAEADIQDAYHYYEECREHLVGDFKNPSLYSVVYKNIHRILVQRFPFGIFFVIKGDVLVVLAVLHGSRSPHRWKLRV